MFFGKSKLPAKFNIKHFSSLPSTNTYLKELAVGGAPSYTVVVADTQSAGRGRMDRSFLSREGGLYMSVLLRPASDLNGINACSSVHITALAAVAVSEAIEAVTGKKTGIKWVNDIFYDGKKLCGILAEGAIDSHGGFEYVVLGIGVNLCGNFENTELKDIATALYPSLDKKTLSKQKNRLISEILTRFYGRYTTELAGGSSIFDDYRSRLFILGEKVEVLQGKSVRNATVIALNDDFTLRVRYDDATEAKLNSGEVRLRITNEKS